MTDDFDALLAGAKRGDEGCFVLLFRSIQPALLRYLGVLGGPLADDVAGETWVSVVKGLDRFCGDEAGWRSWVFTIAHARLRDAQRKLGRVPVPVPDEELHAEVSRIDVWGEVQEILSTDDALRLIARLPRDQAAAVMLRHVVGLDVAQTAGVLGKRAGAVRVSVHRGLRRLAELVGETEARKLDQPSNAGPAANGY
jgi:RNA polymerase sigma-70 factor (ECF subfamily)